MSRARNIKPGFFKNEVLGQEDPFVSLLFAGLWTLADKAGILEDRPLRIKAELFPYREGFDINGYLTVLERLKFIYRYKVNQCAYIQIINFSKHQNPHHTEKESIYPAYLDGCDLTVGEPLINGDAPADSLIPDSLIPDSISKPMSLPATQKADSVPYQKIVDLYHQVLPQSPRVALLNSKRKGQIAARWKSGVLPDLKTWEEYFRHISESPFLMGHCDPPPGRKRFVADFEWITNETNFTKIAEGKYHGKV